MSKQKPTSFSVGSFFSRSDALWPFVAPEVPVCVIVFAGSSGGVLTQPQQEKVFTNQEQDEGIKRHTSRGSKRSA